MNLRPLLHPKAGDHVVRIITNRLGVRGIHSRLVISVKNERITYIRKRRTRPCTCTLDAWRKWCAFNTKAAKTPKAPRERLCPHWPRCGCILRGKRSDCGYPAPQPKVATTPPRVKVSVTDLQNAIVGAYNEGQLDARDPKKKNRALAWSNSEARARLHTLTGI